VTQNYLGNVLEMRDERESGTALLEEAVAARREELTESAPPPAAESITICAN
jgi:hypothetical protein